MFTFKLESGVKSRVKELWLCFTMLRTDPEIADPQVHVQVLSTKNQVGISSSVIVQLIGIRTLWKIKQGR